MQAETVTGPELAELLCIGRGYLSKLVRDGLPVAGQRKSEHGRATNLFDLGAVRLWLYENRRGRMVCRIDSADVRAVVNMKRTQQRLWRRYRAAAREAAREAGAA